MKFHEQNFRAQANRYRRRTRLFLKIVASAMILIAAALLVPDNWSVWLAGPGVALVFAGLITRFTTPGLRCTDCGGSAENFDRFCPVCGIDGLRRYQLTAAKCDKCRREFGQYHARNYTIFFCTHCGKLLDPRGV